MKPGHLYILSLFVLGSFLLSSCKKGIPSDVIQPNRMEALLYDYHIAQAIGNEYNGEERYKKELLMQYVFKKHQTTEAQFDSSLVWYTRHTEELNHLYERVGERLQQSSKTISALTESNTVANAEPITGDTVNLWRQRTLYSLSNAELTNKLTFTIPADTSYRPYDRFVWSVNTLFFENKAGLENAEMELSLRYQNDSTVSVYRSLARGKNKLEIQADTLPLRNVRGVIYYGGDSVHTKMQTLLVYDITLMRYHTPAEEIKKQAEAENDSTNIAAKDSIPTTIEKKDSLLGNEPARLSPKELREQNRPEQIQRKVKPQPKPVPQPYRRRQPTRNNNR